jgi:hypothetical protein
VKKYETPLPFTAVIGRNPENSAAYILTEVGKYVDSEGLVMTF